MEAEALQPFILFAKNPPVVISYALLLSNLEVLQLWVYGVSIFLNLRDATGLSGNHFKKTISWNGLQVTFLELQIVQPKTAQPIKKQ